MNRSRPSGVTGRLRSRRKAQPYPSIWRASTTTSGVVGARRAGLTDSVTPSLATRIAPAASPSRSGSVGAAARDRDHRRVALQAYRQPAGAVGRAHPGQRRRAGAARAEDAVVRWNDAPGAEPAGVHAAAGGADAATEAAPDPLPRGAGAQREAAGAGGAAGTGAVGSGTNGRRGSGPRRVRAGRAGTGWGAAHGLGAAAEARVRHRPAALPEVRWRGAEDHRGDPGAGRDREGPHAPGA
jgi:hypothetical protein